MWDTSGLGGDRINVAESVASQKIRGASVSEPGTPKPRGGDGHGRARPTRGYHPLVSWSIGNSCAMMLANGNDGVLRSVSEPAKGRGQLALPTCHPPGMMRGS